MWVPQPGSSSHGPVLRAQEAECQPYCRPRAQEEARRQRRGLPRPPIVRPGTSAAPHSLPASLPPCSFSEQWERSSLLCMANEPGKSVTLQRVQVHPHPWLWG